MVLRRLGQRHGRLDSPFQSWLWQGQALGRIMGSKLTMATCCMLQAVGFSFVTGRSGTQRVWTGTRFVLELVPESDLHRMSERVVRRRNQPSASGIDSQRRAGSRSSKAIPQSGENGAPRHTQWRSWGTSVSFITGRSPPYQAPVDRRVVVCRHRSPWLPHVGGDAHKL